MKDRKIDFENWNRKELYTHFAHTSAPFWSVTYEEDVTEIYRFAKRNGVSFYHAMIWTVSKAMNSVQAFRYTIREDGIYELSERLPSFTSMKENSEVFQIITSLSLNDSPLDYCKQAAIQAQNQNEFIRYDLESDALIFISCLPWIKVTDLSNEGMTDPADSVPRIAWGRFEEKNGKYLLGMNLEVNHRLIDGIHIAQFHDAFQKIAQSLNPEMI